MTKLAAIRSNLQLTNNKYTVVDTQMHEAVRQ